MPIEIGYHNDTTTSKAPQKGFYRNQIPLIVVTGTATTNAITDRNIKKNAIEISNLMIADKIIIAKEMVEKEMDHHY